MAENLKPDTDLDNIEDTFSNTINEITGSDNSSIGSAINEESAGSTIGSEKSALNPEKKEVTPTVIESSTVTSAPAEIPKEPERSAPASAPINVNIETTPVVIPAPEQTRVEPDFTTTTTSSASSVTTSTSTINETSNVSTSIKEGDITSVLNSEEVENSYISSIYQQIEQFLGELSPELEKEYRANLEAERAASTINEKRESSTPTPEQASPIQTESTKSLVELASEIERMNGTTARPLEITESAPESIPSLESTPINESPGIDSAIGAGESTSINESPSINSSIGSGESSSEFNSALIAEIQKYTGVDFGAESVPSVEGAMETTSSAPNLPKEKTETSVTKEQPTLPAKTEKPVEKSAESVNPPVTATAAAIAAEEVGGVVPESPPVPGQETSPSATGSPTTPEVAIDLSGVEHRLARLELLLSGTLDVRIIE